MVQTLFDSDKWQASYGSKSFNGESWRLPTIDAWYKPRSISTKGKGIKDKNHSSMKLISCERWRLQKQMVQSTFDSNRGLASYALKSLDHNIKLILDESYHLQTTYDESPIRFRLRVSGLRTNISQSDVSWNIRPPNDWWYMYKSRSVPMLRGENVCPWHDSCV